MERRKFFKAAGAGLAVGAASGSTLAQAQATAHPIKSSVELFGAIGDGSTDDTASIQAAINALINGQELSFNGAKTYRITSGLKIYSSNHIFYGNGSTITLDDPSGTLSLFDVGDNATLNSNITLQDFVLMRTQVATSGAAIRARHTSSLTLFRINIYSASKFFYGVIQNRVIESWMTECKISNTVSHGIFAFGTGSGANSAIDLRVSNCLVEYCGGSGFSGGLYLQGIYIRDSIFFGCTGLGLSITGIAGQNYSYKLQECDFDTNTGGGVYLDESDNLQITDCWFSGNGGNNLTLKPTCDGAVISNNQLYGNPTYTNIELWGINVVISGNLIIAGATGLSLKAGASVVTISGNTIRGMTAWAIDLTGMPDVVTTVGNTFKANTFGGVSAGGMNIVTANNNTAA